MVNWLELDYANELAQPAGEPMYLRMVALLRRMITEGRLSEGDSLPPERDFARLTGVSRGTVSLAYDELKRDGIIHAVPGRGSRVATDRNVSTVSRKEQALRLLSNALERLEALGFSPWEVQAFLHLIQLGREGREVTVRCALVDCNPEALELLGRQLAILSHAEIQAFLLEDFARLGAVELAAFDLVLTTESHAPQVRSQLARHPFPPERLLSVAVSPTQETLVALARVPKNASLRIEAESRRFREIIQKHLAGLGHDELILGEDEAPAAGVPICRVVPAHAPLPEGESAIAFDYRIDRGSMLRVEEAVTSLLLHKGEAFMGGR